MAGKGMRSTDPAYYIPCGIEMGSDPIDTNTKSGNPLSVTPAITGGNWNRSTSGSPGTGGSGNTSVNHTSSTETATAGAVATADTSPTSMYEILLATAALVIMLTAMRRRRSY